MENKLEQIEPYKNLLENNYNLILTGAPGTGKTYLAKEIAARMIGCELSDVSKSEQYGFVQFHPSYDYTDFVEGLRPVKSSENQEITFELKDGTFKKFCEEVVKTPDNLFYHFYKEWLDEVIKSNPSTLTLTLKSERPRIFSYNVTDNGIDLKDPEHTYQIQKKKLFSFYKEFPTPKSLDEEGVIQIIKEKLKSEEKIDSIDERKASYYWAILKVISSKIVNIPHQDKFVFIIDEINRGELSKIFGELFFSIDPGYRGVDGAVKTQYSNLQDKPNAFDIVLGAKKGDYGHFFVPNNVYIIGTMNDIDRSVESMDFAMRRRFAWKEITAESSMQMLDKFFEGDELRKIKNRMKHLNKEILNMPGLGSAYQIGGAYFKKYEEYHNFGKLWEYHLKGLLYEYLRGNRDIKDKIKKLEDAYNNESD